MKFLERTGLRSADDLLADRQAGAWLDDLVEQIEQHDPDFASRLVGAARHELKALGRRVEGELPASYGLFVEAMGREQGALLDELPADLSVSKLLARKPPPVVPTGCLAIGLGSADGFDIVALDLSAGGEPPVVEVVGGEVARPLAASLPRLLFQQAFLRFELGLRKSGSEYRLPRRPWERKVLPALKAAGFAPRWFCDDVRWCGWGQSTAVVVERLQGSPWSLRICGDDAASVARAGRLLERSTGAVFLRELPPLCDRY